MAKLLHTSIQDALKGSNFSLFTLSSFLYDVTRQVYAIGAKELNYMWTLNHQTQNLVRKVFVSACLLVPLHASTKLSYALQKIKMEILNISKPVEEFSDFASLLWSFHTAYLPSAEENKSVKPQVGSKRPSTESADPVALHARYSAVTKDSAPHN